VDHALAFVKERETLCRQRQKRGALDFLEECPDLFAGRAMDALVGGVRFPVEQMIVVFGEALEEQILEPVVLDVFHAAFDLALVSRRVGSRRQYHAAVMMRERFDLRIKLRVEPVGLRDRGFEVVDHDRPRHAAEIPERVLKSAEEFIGRLAPYSLAICLAREAQAHAKHVRPTALAVRALDQRALAEVDLGFRARLNLDPSEWQRRLSAEATTESLHRLVAPGEVVLDLEILPDALRT